MFVINRVELIALDQLQQMRKLEGKCALGFQQARQTSSKVVEVGHMRKYIVGYQQIGLSPLRNKLLGQTGPHESNQGRDVPSLRRACDVCRRLYSKNRDANRFKILEQVSVIARRFDYDTISVKRKTPARGFGKSSRMVKPAL